VYRPLSASAEMPFCTAHGLVRALPIELNCLQPVQGEGFELPARVWPMLESP
jgi:hypothetical protein